jgi:hypothetical protein
LERQVELLFALLVIPARSAWTCSVALVIPMESDDYNLSDPIPTPPDSYVEEPA